MRSMPEANQIKFLGPVWFRGCACLNNNTSGAKNIQIRKKYGACLALRRGVNAPMPDGYRMLASRLLPKVVNALSK